MTDYKNLKLIATSNPHIRGNETTRSIMLDVIIAMCPALIWAVIYFGVEALLLTAVSVVGCVFFEWAYRKIMNKPQSVGDLSAVVTGMLLAFVCPATTPLWMVLVGDFFAIVVVKQLFGGIGKNFLNPALAGRAALLASYAGTMTSWLPAGTKAVIGGGMPADVVSAATPLAYLKTGNMDGLKEIASVGDMFLGKIGGSMGEISALMLLIGGTVPAVAQGHQLADPRGLHRHRGSPDPAVPQGRLRRGVYALQHLRRRPVPGRVLHGHRLCHLPRHREGPADLRHRLRPVHRVHPVLRLLQ